MKTFNRKKTLLLAACITTVMVMAGLPQLVFASGVDAPGDVFQMEGDAQKTDTICFGTDTNGAPAIATPVSGVCPTVGTWDLVTFGANTDDWSNVYSGSGKHYNAKSFDPDLTNSSLDNVFLGTASKDTDDLSAWSWKVQKPQAKDDIAHAFAAAYTSTENSHTYIVAGMDRYANNGDATAGFWFVQDSNFALCTGNGTDTDGANPACKANLTFVGHHTDGDMLLVSDFSTGGSVSTINVFVWSGGTLVLSQTRSPAPCNPVTDDSELCGLVNNAYTQGTDRKGNAILVPANVSTGGWPFSDTKGNSTYLTGEFLEVAIDLNAVFGSNVPCFSKFMGETRSSTSVNASLSDLTNPVSFPLCSLSVTKICTGSQISTDSNGNNFVRYSFGGNINNTGLQTIYHPNLKDTVPTTGYIADSLTINGNPATPGSYIDLTGTIAGGETQAYTGTLDSTAILSGSGDNVKNFVSAKASSNSSGTPQNVGPSDANWGNPDSCKPPVAPGLKLEKKCKTCLVSNGTNLDVNVSEGVNIINTGNVAINGIVIKDCRGGSWTGNDPATATCNGGTAVTLLSGGSLAAGASQIISTTITPKDCYGRNGNCSFSDAVIASGTAALSGATVTAVQISGSCDVCGINDTCPTYDSNNWSSP